MPRPKSKRASQNFILHPKSLPEAERKSLLKLLGYSEETLASAITLGYRVVERKPGAPTLAEKVTATDSIDRDPYMAIYSIETAIALATEGARHLDDIPRPADYREEFTKLQKAVLRVLGLLNGWSEYYRDQLTFHGEDVHQIEQTLGTLYDISGDVVAAMKGQLSKGAPKQNALVHAIRQLKQICRKYYCGTPSKVKRVEAKFVRQALEVGRAIPLGYEGLNKLMRDPRCNIDEPSVDGWRS